MRRKVKGTKVRRVPTEEPDFYDKAWENHFEPTMPKGLKATPKVVSPLLRPTDTLPAPVPSALTALAPASPAVVPEKADSGHLRIPTFTSIPTITSFVDILPASARDDSLPVAQVSDEESSWDSLDLDLDTLMDDDLLVLEGADGKPFHLLDGFDLATLETPSVVWEDSVAALAAAM